MALGVPALPGATLTDRLRLLTILAGRGGRTIRRVLAIPSRATRLVRTRAPERLLIAPQDIRTSDPTIAADIGAGYFAFGGKIVSAQNQSPFELDPASDHWARQLAGFGWLRHLRAADRPGARAGGRQLVDDFIAAHPRPAPGPAWEPRVVARRLLAWLSQSPIVLDGADRAFYNRFMQALATNCGVLERQMLGGLSGEDRLIVALALAEFGLCAQTSAAAQRRTTDLLAAEIAVQILPDGGHVGRNPQTLIDLLLDLLPLRQAYAARGLQAPQQLLNAIDRMMPMLRMFRHGDGSLALFNGMGLTAPELVATVLAYDDARAQPLTNAPATGYQRLEAARTIVLMDAGPAPPKAFSSRAHAGCLAFELSSGLNRFVVNCGAPDASRASARTAARTTAAHSTLVLDDTSSCRFAAAAGLQRWLGDQILAGPTQVPVERRQREGEIVVGASHDGYAARFGLLHRRELALAADGAHLMGIDRLVESGRRKSTNAPFALRFHLHPAIRARPEGGAIRLEARDGESWTFACDLEPVIEPSILFAASGGPRPTTQIKVSAHSAEQREIAWSLHQTSSPDGRR